MALTPAARWTGSLMKKYLIIFEMRLKKMNRKTIYEKYKPILRPVLMVKNRLFSLRVRGGRGNRIIGLDRCMVKNSRVHFSGRGNVVEIGDMSTLNGVSISIAGSGNRVILGARTFLMGCAFSIEDDGNHIEIGEHTYIYNQTELAAIEGTGIRIGEDCLISSDAALRTGDSHSILDANGKRINPSGDIVLGRHVWLCKDVKVLKNARIGNDCIIGTGAVITGTTPEMQGTIFAGSPARPVKSNITWDVARLPVEKTRM